ncbi:hypothetical protein ACHAXT_012979 [Thalassiosira profunda]
MNLILIKPSDQSKGDGVVDLSANDERSKHIRAHLRKKTGDTVSIGLVDSDGGCKGQATVLERKDGGIRLSFSKLEPCPALPEITLVLAVPFPARLKYLWPVIASFASVTRIVILRGKLSNPEFCETSALKPSVYEPMIEKGLSQGCRTRPVKVDVAVEDEDVSKDSLERLGLVGNGTDGIARIFLDCGDEHETPPPARDVVLEQCGEGSATIPSAIVAVGPERGWTEEEANMFVKECGFRSATLGCSVLRVDTAVVAGLGIVSAALDECHKRTEVPDCGDSKRQKLGSPETQPP